MHFLLACLAKCSLACVALTVFFYMLSLAVPKAAFVARLLAAYLGLVVSCLYGVAASIFLALIGKPGSAQWAAGRLYHHAMRCTAGIEFVVDDPGDALGTTRPAVFIGNHQTELDVVMLGAVFPMHCSITAKASLKRLPILGWFMALSGSIFLDRHSSKGARSAMQDAAREMRAKRQSVYMFPEGTRSYAKEPTLLPFKKGAFYLAVQAGVPIVPCVVANYSHVLHIKTFLFNSGRIPVKVLDPIPTTGLTSADVDELARSTREVMLKELFSLTEKARGRPVAVPTSATTARSSAVDTGK